MAGESWLDDADTSGGIGTDSQGTAYTPIKVLGRGAFGEAVLYRREEDNTLVVWKEVDLQRLGERERKEAMNEIDILSLLNHCNIVSYYNHFLDGEILLIEMEYANGGTLYEKICMQTDLFSEEMVLWYFYQLTSAVSHMHEFGILHRDIKTLNIFLTRAAVVKLGDFGISKMLASKSDMAQSYVGTPYYMSPELIKGEQYNMKSDIWAVGCVLYELCTLSKVFDATNPLKLAHEIVMTDFEAISNKYSDKLKHLLGQCLNKDPEERPRAEAIVDHELFTESDSEYKSRLWDLNVSTRKLRMSVTNANEVVPVVTSKSSEVFYWGGGKSTPQQLDFFAKGRSGLQLSVGKAHYAVVTVESELYTWAATSSTSMVGQLGHGDTAAYKAPKKVEAFEGVAVRQVSCGEDFTVCITEDGSAYSFGSDYYGCLGCDNEEGEEVCTPVEIHFFSSHPVMQVSCGEAHVVALTRDCQVYAWGCGEYGRLGLGSEDDFATPQKVETRGQHTIRSVHAGPDSTFLLNSNGRVLACGSNEYNKLGFNSRAQGLGKKKEISYDIPCQDKFTTIKPLSKYHIVQISTGRTHTAAVDGYGHLLTFGCNRHGQLGVGDFKRRYGVTLVRGPLTGLLVSQVACGDSFTVIATADNELYSCGLSENGRLGLVLNEKGSGPGDQCYAYPRNIFGSLHLVSDMASNHWYTIVVAEKVLAQKTIRSSASTTSSKVALESQVSCFSDGVFEDEEEKEDTVTDVVGCSTSLGESSVPAWLAMELADAEFISAEEAECGAVSAAQPKQQQASAFDNEDVPDAALVPPVAPVKSNLSLIEQLQCKIAQLEVQNYQLQQIVAEQKVTIDHLQSQHVIGSEITEAVWQAVDHWAAECRFLHRTSPHNGQLGEGHRIQHHNASTLDDTHPHTCSGSNLIEWDSEMNTSITSEDDPDIQGLLSSVKYKSVSYATKPRPLSNRSSASFEEEDVPMASPLSSPLDKMEPRGKKRKSGRCFVAIGNQNGHHSKPGTPTDLHSTKDDNDNNGVKSLLESKKDEVGHLMELDNAQYSINGNSQSTDAPHYKTVDELDSKFPFRSVMNVSLSLQASSETETV